jgi:hypothetical protein
LDDVCSIFVTRRLQLESFFPLLIFVLLEFFTKIKRVKYFKNILAENCSFPFLVAKIDPSDVARFEKWYRGISPFMLSHYYYYQQQQL